jgi:hypothetical protein
VSRDASDRPFAAVIESGTLGFRGIARKTASMI